MPDKEELVELAEEALERATNSGTVSESKANGFVYIRLDSALDSSLIRYMKINGFTFSRCRYVKEDGCQEAMFFYRS